MVAYAVAISMELLRYGKLNTIVGYTDYVNYLIQLMDGRLCSGSDDSTIKIWSIETGVCELSINAQYAVSLVQLRNGSICSGDLNGMLQIWNSATGVCEMALSGHTNHVTSIFVINDKRICSCSWDKTLKIWITSSDVFERNLAV
jgi:WD40 repeat protein